MIRSTPIPKAKPDDLNKLEVAFKQAMQNCYQVLGKCAFRRWLLNTPSPKGSVNRAIFESQAIALADYPPEHVLANKDVIQEALRSLFSDPTYDNAVSFGTGSYRKVNDRLEMPRKALRKIL